MGEFRLQVGDVVTIQRNPEPKIVEMVGRLNIWFANDPVAYTLFDLRTMLKEVHRPTPSGLVQVWPEVEGA